MNATLALLASTSLATTDTDALPVGPVAPAVIPAPPAPNWSWDTIPLSFHGAVKDREFSDKEIDYLGKFLMYTPEKWYTPCGSQGPTQAGPECAIEAKTERLFGRVRARNPNMTTILYWNTMFDFSFYTAHQRMLDLEAAGTRAFLRDETGAVISLCNDGNVYCNITTFDWTQPAVRALWIEQVTNATATGLVDGIFADHATGNGVIIGNPDKNGQGRNQLCNGKGAGRACYNFTAAFTASFNSWHLWGTNYTQDLLSKTTGGPVIQGSLARMDQFRTFDPCDFDSMRAGTYFNNYSQSTISIIEAKPQGGCKKLTETCLAAFLATVRPHIYMHCMSSDEDIIGATSFAEMDKPLGEPDGDAAEVPTAGSNVWRRTFASGTTVLYDNNAKRGNITWGGKALAS